MSSRSPAQSCHFSVEGVGICRGGGGGGLYLALQSPSAPLSVDFAGSASGPC